MKGSPRGGCQSKLPVAKDFVDPLTYVRVKSGTFHPLSEDEISRLEDYLARPCRANIECSSPTLEEQLLISLFRRIFVTSVVTTCEQDSIGYLVTPARQVSRSSFLIVHHILPWPGCVPTSGKSSAEVVRLSPTLFAFLPNDQATSLDRQIQRDVVGLVHYPLGNHTPRFFPIRYNPNTHRAEVALMNDITQILAAIEQGNPVAAEQLLPLVYDELRKLAAQRLANEPRGQTLQPTALVHEAYLRLVGGGELQQWDHRGHFFAAAATAMRRILIERARQKKRHIHGGGRRREELHPDLAVASVPDEELLALDAALCKLSRTRSVEGSPRGVALFRRNDRRSGRRNPGDLPQHLGSALDLRARLAAA